jgi:hypothetical protein
LQRHRHTHRLLKRRPYRGRPLQFVRQARPLRPKQERVLCHRRHRRLPEWNHRMNSGRRCNRSCRSGCVKNIVCRNRYLPGSAGRLTGQASDRLFLDNQGIRPLRVFKIAVPRRPLRPAPGRGPSPGLHLRLRYRWNSGVLLNGMVRLIDPSATNDRRKRNSIRLLSARNRGRNHRESTAR